MHGRAKSKPWRTVEKAEAERDKSENGEPEKEKGVKRLRSWRGGWRGKEQEEEEEWADERSQRAPRRRGWQMVAMVMAVRHDIVFEGATDRQTERQRSRELLSQPYEACTGYKL